MFQDIPCVITGHVFIKLIISIPYIKS